MKEHPFAQPEGPDGELLVVLPALGQAGDEVAPLVDIGQAIIHGGGGMYLVVLIMPMRVEASDIVARAILQDAASLGMPLARRRMIGKAEGGHADERSTSGYQKFTSGEIEAPIYPSSGHP